MATRLVCDKCGSAQSVKTLQAVVGRERDAAGSMGDEVERVDICAACAQAQLSCLIARMGHEQAREFFNRIKAGRRSA